MTTPQTAARADLADFFKHADLFPALDESQIRLAAKNCSIETYHEGDVILKSDHDYDALRVLFHGSVDVVLESPEESQKFVVAQIDPGAPFGEKGFLKMGSASANVVALDSVTVLAISRDDAIRLGIYHGIVESIASAQSERLQRANSKQVEALQNSIDQQVEQNYFGRFYIATIMLFAIISLIPDYSSETPAFQLMIRWVFLFFILLPSIYAVRQQDVPLSVFGLNTTGWRRSLFEGLLVGTAVLPLLVLFKIFGSPADEPLITWKTIDNYSDGQLAFYLVTYIPHALIQEFIARGVEQGSLQRFMPEAHFLKPIVIAGLLFAILHLHLSVGAAVLTFVVSLLFGYLYYRHKTLVGVVALHTLLGVSATALGLI